MGEAKRRKQNDPDRGNKKGFGTTAKTIKKHKGFGDSSLRKKRIRINPPAPSNEINRYEILEMAFNECKQQDRRFIIFCDKNQLSLYVAALHELIDNKPDDFLLSCYVDIYYGEEMPAFVVSPHHMGPMPKSA